MKIIKSYLENNPCYQAGEKIKVKGLMLHSVGCSQPKASVFINMWNKKTFNRACVHGFIDGNDGVVYQTLPWEYRGWHCGGKANDTHIGIELCEPACIKYTEGSNFTCTDKEKAKEVVKRTYDAAVELFASLCKKYKLDPLADGVIISHKEGNKKGLASNHGDPEHLWKGLDTGYTMEGFRRAVAKKLNTKSEVKETVPFKVYIPITNLNIRRAAGINAAKTGKYTGKGVFTIVEVRSGKGSDKGWGKLKSGVGWIALDYVEKI